MVGAFDLDDSVIEAMQAWGAPADEIEQARTQIDNAAPPPVQDTFGVHADNLPTVLAFQAVSTQWQRAGMAGQRVGLCYAGVSAWLDLFVRRRDRRSVMQGLQVMERAVLAADQEQREKNQGE